MLLVLVITAVTYLLLYLSAGNIARNILGQNATQEQVAQKSAELGLDQPLFVRYWDWLNHAIRGDLGVSWFGPDTVLSSLSYRVPVTLSLALGATIITAIVAVVIGIAAARRGGWLDKLVQVLAVVGFAVPGFVIALLLVLWLAIQVHLFPATGYVPPAQSVTGWLSTITLPIVALTIGATAATAQQVRGSAYDLLQRDFVRTLRSRGLSENAILFRYVLKNAAGPGLTVLSLQFISLLGGAVIVEQIFAIPGLGTYSIQAAVRGDVPAVMGVVVVTVIIVVLVNLVIDLANAWLDPRVRTS